MAASSPRRLPFRWFLLAIVIGALMWLGVDRWLQPQPRWAIHFDESDPRMFIMYEDASGRWLVGETNQRNVVILNAATGKKHAQLSDIAQFNFWGPTTYGHYPRLIGNHVWRMVALRDETIARYELRRWDFLESKTEVVVHTWEAGLHDPFEVTFAPDDAPYFLVQTMIPWDVQLATLNVDGWSALLNVQARAALKKDLGSSPQRLSLAKLDNPSGSWIPWIRTYALPIATERKATQLASWTLPVFRWTWPPMVGRNMKWVAFGDSTLPVGWKSPMKRDDGRNSVLPTGVLVYDGHTGQPKPLPIRGYGKVMASITSLGDVLRVHQDGMSRGYTAAEYQYVDVNTGQVIAWDEAMLHPGRVSYETEASWVDEHRYWCRQRSEKRAARSATTPDSLQLHHYAEGKFQYLRTITLPVDKGSNPFLFGDICIHDNQAVLSGNSIQHSPWYGNWKPLPPTAPWYEVWMNKLFAPMGQKVVIMDTTTGEILHTLPDRSGSATRAMGNSHTLLTRKYTPVTGNPFHCSLMEAWDLPMVLHSPWWSRGTGVLVFILSLLWFCLRRRGRQRVKEADAIRAEGT